jgi:hypothetical protein
MAPVTGTGDSLRTGNERWNDRSSESPAPRGSRAPVAPARRPTAPVPLSARRRADAAPGGAAAAEALAPRVELPARRAEDATSQDREALGRHELRQQVLEAGETPLAYGHQAAELTRAPVAALLRAPVVARPKGPAAAVLQALMSQALRFTTQALRDELATQPAWPPARRAAPAA